HDFATAFKTPFISGKDSLYNESPLGPVTPTLLITALGMIPDVRLAVSMDVKTPNNLMYIVGQTFKELGGSEYYRLKGFLGKTVPKVQKAHAKKTFRTITKAIDSGFVKACHDLSEGGLAVAAAEMAFAGGYGIELDLRKVPGKALDRNDFVLFAESNSRFLVEVSEKSKKDFEVLMKGKSFARIGEVTDIPRLKIKGLNGRVVVDASLKDLSAFWKRTSSSEV
ncbi:MAG: AIR synthase-related protein, partial [Candidatus Bathyarchaeota archaeon]|nr:AIR synthase-related protein [Candidatus Bathyarchaeota archaeon]